MSKSTAQNLPINLKEQNARHTVHLTIKNKEHFYKIVMWLNKNIGRGTEFWTTKGRVLRSIRKSNGKSVNATIYIFRQDVDTQACLILSLL